MGIPSFFRWLVDRFPKVVVDVIESGGEIDGVPVAVDTTLPNPNGEYDNLYLDMNGIIHPCCHPQGKAAPETEELMLVEIGKYIDRLFAIVRPRKVLYMAVDGVAPRAKMNQQRSRRFRAAREARLKKETEAQIRKERGEEPEEDKVVFDSNCITPGTPFMTKISNYLKYYAADRLTNDPGWKGVKVIISDSNVPGEGEHKLMEFIRQQRSTPDHDPNTRHCIYGLDADLIMLSLATHEPHFSILRETVTGNKKPNCFRCGQTGHFASDCTGEKKDPEPEPITYQLLHVNILREYLNHYLYVENLAFEYDLERVIDDFVFLCFFIGNDFLPHLPTLEIRENAIGLLSDLYKKVLPTNGYLTKDGELYPERVEALLVEVGHLEHQILVNRLEKEKQMKERRKSNRQRGFQNNQKSAEDDNLKKNMDAAAALRASMSSQPDPSEGSRPTKKIKMSSDSLNDSTDLNTSTGSLNTSVGQEEDEPVDEVRLGEEGWRERYYEKKFGVKMDDESFFKCIRAEYLRGLSWVLKYYYVGCPSWNWYFPYHYAPFSKELVKLAEVNLVLEKGTPFKPFEQLMSVLPPDSALHVPEHYRPLMTDPKSPILEFYPTELLVDMNGKKQDWLAVVLLPFIDEKKLLKALAPVEATLTEEERERNSTRTDLLFVAGAHAIAPQLLALKTLKGEEEWVQIDPQLSSGMSGEVAKYGKAVYPGDSLASPATSDVISLNCVSAKYKVLMASVILRGLLKNVTLPERKLTTDDLENREAYRDRNGYHRNQNSAANRMINHSIGNSNQYKMNRHQQDRSNHQYNPYSRDNGSNRYNKPRYDNRQDRGYGQDRGYDDRRSDNRGRNYDNRYNDNRRNDYPRDNRYDSQTAYVPKPFVAQSDTTGQHYLPQPVAATQQQGHQSFVRPYQQPSSANQYQQQFYSPQSQQPPAQHQPQYQPQQHPQQPQYTPQQYPQQTQYAQYQPYPQQYPQQPQQYAQQPQYSQQQYSQQPQYAQRQPYPQHQQQGSQQNQHRQ